MLFLILLGWGHDCGTPGSISTLSRKKRTAMGVPSSVESVQQHRTSSEKSQRKSGSWLKQALIQHVTRCINTESDSKGNAKTCLKALQHQPGSIKDTSVSPCDLPFHILRLPQPHQSQLLTDEWLSRILDWYYQLLEWTRMKKMV